MGSNEEKKALVTIGSNLPAIQTVEDLARLGKMFELSGLFGCSQQGQGAVLVMTCLSEHISPVEFAKTYNIIDGNISMKADAMLAKFVERGGKYKILERSKKRAAAIFEKDGNTFTSEFTIEDAAERHLTTSKRTGKEKDNWKYGPDDMLWARMSSRGVRVTDPGVNFGTYTPEEISDFTRRPDNTPREDGHLFGSDKLEATTTPTTPATANNEDPFPSLAPATELEPDPDYIAYNTIPFGKLKGKKWEDLSVEQLKISETLKRPEMLDGHRRFIDQIITKKRIKKEENAA